MVGSSIESASREPAMREGGRNRLLIAVAVTATVILVGAVAFLLLQDQRPRPFAAGTPERVVQDFLQAVEAHDYQQAFGYLTPTIDTSEGQQPRSYQDFRDQFPDSATGRSGQVRVTLDAVTIDGDNARVTVVFSQFAASSAPFFSSAVYQTRAVFTLRRWAGQWRIDDYPYVVLTLM